MIITAAMALALAPALAAPPAPVDVIIVGVDGLSPRGVDEGITPRLNELMARGVYTFHARGVFPTSSSSNWASMINGAGPEQHGVTSNDWERWNRPILPSATGMEDIFPTIFGQLHAQRPDAVIASIYDWGAFGRLYERAAVDIDTDAEGPDQAAQLAIQAFNKDHPALLFVHLDHVDHAGHTHGWHTPEYFAAVEHADALIGTIADAVTAADRWDRTVLIVTSDHGGVNKSHGGETMAELEIPWIIAGAGIAQGREITRTVNTFDTAATAAHLLAINPNPAWIGRPVLEATLAHTDASGVTQRAYVPAPRFNPPGGLVTTETVIVAMDCEDPAATIHFTTDGSEPTPASPVYAGPITLPGSGEVRAIAIRGPATSRVSADRYRIVSAASPKPVEYAYFEGDWLTLPDFAALTPIRTGAVPEIGLHFIPHREDHFAVRFRTAFRVTTPGTYAFHVASDDGSRLEVNGRRIIDNDGSHGMIERSGEIDLAPGVHELIVEYFEDFGGEEVVAHLTGPDKVRVPLSYNLLSKPAPE